MDKKFEEMFGSNVFNKIVMKKMLSSDVYTRLEQTIDERKELDMEIADEVAKAMKHWAMSKGATHYTHWFQPLTGITAEKHDGFISREDDGSFITDFSGKELIKGEPDASSFPSGGLRSTFEARGYTAWDPTSFAFIKGNTLFIPTAFCSFTGEALDKKTPLLKSMDALSKQAVRIVKLFGIDARSVNAMVGPEQEYFLIDKEVFKQRKDLMLCGRTLFGAPCPKAQQLDDHYFGIIKPRVQEFMIELNETLWKLGVPAKTEHNEVAPAQHELAPIFESCNIATDHNQLTMEIMKTVAQNHDLVCLLNEKPFAGVNGSGKHNNWSIVTDSGINLLKPGHTPEEHLRFYLFLTAIIKAVDEYQDLIRVSVAAASNDNRLGANEAPPAIVSVFLGEELTNSLLAVSEESCKADPMKKYLDLGVASIPSFVKDSTDRNRTSPFAFTGNKFELRMLGSSNSIACANIMLNSAVASVLKDFADILEKDSSAANIIKLINKEVSAHKRILFNGNGYGDEWVKEAEKRGLLNLRTTPDCLPYVIKDKNIKMLTEIGTFSSAEIYSRYTIQLENYCASTLIETRTMLEMANEDYLPAISRYTTKLANAIILKKQVSSSISCEYEQATFDKLSILLNDAQKIVEKIEDLVSGLDSEDILKKAMFIKDSIIPAQEELRAKIDAAERICPEGLWPYPRYGKIMFSVI